MRSKHLLVGNWKMNLGPSQATTFAEQLRSQLSALSRTDVWVAPPTISLPEVQRTLVDSPVLVGAQNVHWATSGAFTGETSPVFLREMGITFSLIGHSERRTYFGETSETVAQRTKAALTAGLTAIVCIGETEHERTSGITEAVLDEQLGPVFDQVSPEESSRVILAYEPVWAIGTGRVASLEDIAATHSFIISRWNTRGFAANAVVLYGGSVNPQNCADILALKEVDGALVGGASIKLDQWLHLVRIAEETALHSA